MKNDAIDVGDFADHTYLRLGVFHFQSWKRTTNSLQIEEYIIKRLALVDIY